MECPLKILKREIEKKNTYVTYCIAARLCIARLCYDFNVSGTTVFAPTSWCRVRTVPRLCLISSSTSYTASTPSRPSGPVPI